MLVALTALAFALSGAAVAATKIGTSDDLPASNATLLNTGTAEEAREIDTQSVTVATPGPSARTRAS